MDPRPFPFAAAPLPRRCFRSAPILLSAAGTASERSCTPVRTARHGSGLESATVFPHQFQSQVEITSPAARANSIASGSLGIGMRGAAPTRYFSESCPKNRARVVESRQGWQSHPYRCIFGELRYTFPLLGSLCSSVEASGRGLQRYLR